jgi:DNA-binding response OmpR family regulator
MNDRADKPGSSGNGATTVMVVEPDILIRMVIADYLRECGYRVIEGLAAADVHAVLRAGEPVHIVMADVELADGADGFHLAREIRRNHPDIDVILSSSAARSAEKAGDLCDDGPLEKPYHPQEALRRIAALRERRRNHTAET